MNSDRWIGTAMIALCTMMSAAGCDDDVTAPTGPAGPVVGSIALELEVDTLSVGQTTQLQATVLSVDGDTLADRAITFLSSDNDIATISVDGLVTAEGSGTATLTAQVADVTATAVVYVRRVRRLGRAASISVAPSDTTLVVDDLLRLAVTVRDVDGNTLASVARFSISNRAVVTEGTNRLEFQAVGVGNAVITAETEGLTASVDVEVKPSEVGRVTLLPDSLTIAVYDTARLTVIVWDTTGAVIANPHVVFSVNGLMVDTVDSTGLVTGRPGGCGVGTIIARSRGVNSNTVDITVGSPSGAGCWDY